MAGIYIHIPFCNKKCYYCDFYSITNLKNKDYFIKALIKEISLKKNYLKNNKITTLYFGGGTPTILNISDLKKIINKIHKTFDLSKLKEFTIEANPENLTKDYINKIKQLGVNRISIGVQSFFDDDLKLMNRNHTGKQANKAIENILQSDIKNFSIDLIYGLPNSDIKKWEQNILTAIKYNPLHISAYHLTYEPKTVFYKYIKNKKITPVTENLSIEQYNLLTQILKENKFEHYEISNFAKQKKYSLHNTNYWKNKKYLGLGPSAHSFNKTSRQWNISDISKYIEFVNKNKIFYEKEILSDKDKFNDYIITKLRTKWGIKYNDLSKKFNQDFINHYKKQLSKYKTNNAVITNNNNFILTEKTFFISDKIIEDFIIC